MCLDCLCMKPMNEHRDKRHITYRDYQNGDRAQQSTADVNGYKSITEASNAMKKTLAAIKSGKLSPTKR